MMLVVIGMFILAAGALTVVMVVSRSQKATPSNDRSSLPSNPTRTVDQSKSACGYTMATALYDKWIQMGGASGKLGCPIANDVDAPTSPQATTGRWAQFTNEDGGYLIKHESGPRAGQVFEVTGCMYKLYSSQGGTKSWLGFPVGDGYTTAPGARQEFEGGYVVWDSKTYQCQAHKQ
jgi:uncharacterized protein with LGFP repeats